MKETAYLLQAALVSAWWVSLAYSTTFFAAFQFDKIWITEPGTSGGPHKLNCYDAKSMALIWTNEVNGSGRSGVMWRGIGHLSEFKAFYDLDLQNSSDDTITVYGNSGAAFYAHAFDKSTGRTVLRFSTEYVPYNQGNAG